MTLTKRFYGNFSNTKDICICLNNIDIEKKFLKVVFTTVV